MLRNYKPRNKETNELFFRFNQMAKILFVGRASSQLEFSYQAFFDLLTAAETLQQYNDNRGTGACYMILGIMLAMQSGETYMRSIKYMKYSERLQQKIIDGHQRNKENLTNRSNSVKLLDLENQNEVLDEELNQRMTEDQYILAFRQYTRAIISYNFFVLMEEESRHRFLFDSEKRRLNHMRLYDRVALEALEYFEKCLSSWPDPNMVQTDMQDTVKSGIFSAGKNDNRASANPKNEDEANFYGENLERTGVKLNCKPTQSLDFEMDAKLFKTQQTQ